MAKATRPLFIPDTNELVGEKHVEFEWFMGMAPTQKQKSIEALHKKAKEAGYQTVLEISTYSPEPLGVKLSAFNLRFSSSRSSGTVEELYQKSKVIERLDGVGISEKNGTKGLRPTSFNFEGFKWPLEPLSAFYDWLYINALKKNTDLSNAVCGFQAFTDIAYNPKKSLSTQARSAALYVSLAQLGKIEQTQEPQEFLQLLKSYNYMRAAGKLFF